MIHHFDELGSTNDEAAVGCYSGGDIIVAERQTQGRGQRGHTWISGVGQNLTFSLVVEPGDLKLREQFIISQITALALCDVMQTYGIKARIKWTNDIYVGDRKIVGILIENRVVGAHVARSVVGIGVNVNQTEFDSSLPNPTSMALESGAELEREEVLRVFEMAFAERFATFESGDWETLRAEYNALLYRKGELHNFRAAEGEVRRGAIQKVESAGELVIEWDNAEIGSYLFRQVEFII